jgi:hydrogenase-4 component F
LVLAAQQAQTPWLKAAFIFILVGYGAKMGLAPLHNWLPDAHSEAPSPVSALLSGALLNCAFLGILRAHQIMIPAGLGEFSGGLLVFFGLVSMGAATIFIVGMGHFKRLLAYSSVEHMGILALGVGLGGKAVFGAMLHAVNHSLVKAMLFLLAGNILRQYRTPSSHDVRGMRHTMPLTAALWMAGFLAVAGSPPFGLFVSEFSILQAMLQEGRIVVALVYLALLAVVFVGMSVPVLRMVQASPPPGFRAAGRESLLNTGPPLVLCALVLMLGLYVPPWMAQCLRAAAGALGG